MVTGKYVSDGALPIGAVVGVIVVFVVLIIIVVVVVVVVLRRRRSRSSRFLISLLSVYCLMKFILGHRAAMRHDTIPQCRN